MTTGTELSSGFESGINTRILINRSKTLGKFAFEIGSAMMPCPFCFGKEDTLGMTLNDGGLWTRNRKMTTLDAIKVNSFYCAANNENSNYKKGKEIMECLEPDETGLIPPVFKDRVCDNFRDCPGGEDEDGTLGKCKATEC